MSPSSAGWSCGAGARAAAAGSASATRWSSWAPPCCSRCWRCGSTRRTCPPTCTLARSGSGLPPSLYCGAIGLALALIDLDCRRLPNAIVLPSYPVLAVLLTASAWWRDDWWSLARAGIGGVALFGFYLVLALAYPAGMGFGDVRLAGILGGVLGYLSGAALPIGAFGGFLLGAVAGVVVLATGKGGRKTALPF